MIGLIQLVSPLQEDKDTSLATQCAVTKKKHTPREPGGIQGPDDIAKSFDKSSLDAIHHSDDIVDEKGTNRSEKSGPSTDAQ